MIATAIQNIALLIVVLGITSYGVFEKGMSPSAFLWAAVIILLAWSNYEEARK